MVGVHQSEDQVEGPLHSRPGEWQTGVGLYQSGRQVAEAPLQQAAGPPGSHPKGRSCSASSGERSGCSALFSYGSSPPLKATLKKNHITSFEVHLRNCKNCNTILITAL